MSKLAAIAPEWRRFTDKETGAAILQWTSHPSMQHHFYFTNRTTSPDGSRGYFVSYRTGHPNLFAIDLKEGTITQLSERVDINPFSPAASPRDPWICFSAGNKVIILSTEDGAERELASLGDCSLGNCSLSADGALLAIGCRHADYCELALIETATGKTEILTREEEIGHIQFRPSDSGLLMYSGTATQRLWIHNCHTGKNVWVYPQREGEWIVHESWLGRGEEIIFPHWPHALCAIRPDGSGLRTIAEVNAWHARSNETGTLIVCDTNHPDHGLLLIDPQSGAIRALCHPKASQRGTQWQYDRPAAGAGIDTSIIRSKTPENDPPPKPEDPPSTYGPQWSHPHPAFSPDGESVLFTSDGDRWSQVYQVRLPPPR